MTWIDEAEEAVADYQKGERYCMGGKYPEFFGTNVHVHDEFIDKVVPGLLRVARAAEKSLAMLRSHKAHQYTAEGNYPPMSLSFAIRYLEAALRGETEGGDGG